MVAAAVRHPDVRRSRLDRLHRRRDARLHVQQSVPGKRRHAQRVRRDRQQKRVGRRSVARGERAARHVAQQIRLDRVAAVKIRCQTREQTRGSHASRERMHVQPQRRRQRRQRGAQRGRVGVAAAGRERPPRVLKRSRDADQSGPSARAADKGAPARRRPACTRAPASAARTRPRPPEQRAAAAAACQRARVVTAAAARRAPSACPASAARFPSPRASSQPCLRLLRATLTLRRLCALPTASPQRRPRQRRRARRLGKRL